MTLKKCLSAKSLAVYPHLQRNSQCGSCSTVMPGDICFNCGRISTLLVTPRTAMTSTKIEVSAIRFPAPGMTRLALQGDPFHSQYHQIQCLLKARKESRKACLTQHAFDSQFGEIDGMLNAKRKLAQVCTPATDDAASIHGRESIVSSRRSSWSQVYQSSPSSISARNSDLCCSRSSKNMKRSDSIARSDVLDRDGRPHADVAAQWMQGMEPSGRCAAKVSRRGVNCRIYLNGKICEWVVFL